VLTSLCPSNTVPAGPGGDLVIQRRHVERALTLDADAEPSALVGLLWRAARAFVQEAERRQGRGETLPLDLTEAFRGMVLGAAVQAKESRDDAFVLLGQEALLKNRNHHPALERELVRVRDLLISDNYFCRLATITSAGGSAVRTACATVRS
jgi:hypothetical protein